MKHPPSKRSAFSIVKRDKPQIHAYQTDGAATLLVGLSPEGGFAQWSVGSDPPYWVTLGDPIAQGIIMFDYCGHETEVERRHLVGSNSIATVVTDFAANGRRSEAVEWIEI